MAKIPHARCLCVEGSDTTRPMKNEDMQHTERAESVKVRWMSGVGLKNIISSEELSDQLRVIDFADAVRQERFRRFDHL